MAVTGYTQQTCGHDAPDDAQRLDIEIVRDEHYKQNTVYCSWQEIIAGETFANTGSPHPVPWGISPPVDRR